jgi:hypothetical protein
VKVLVYIPCHSDFAQGIEQANKLRSDFESKEFSKDTLEIIMSVNAHQPPTNEIENARLICDEVILHGLGYMADVNIASGFLKALDRKPDIFWLLSTNDSLVPGALSNILSEFRSDSSVDLVVANALGLTKTFEESQIIDPGKPGFSYGVISGAIYKLNKFLPYLHNGPYMAWTGWSHLAVMQSAMDGNNGLVIRTIPDNKIYSQRERELLLAGKYYGHSIYGMLILGSILKKNQKDSQKFIRRYVYKNFYNFHLYSRKWKYKGQISESTNYLAWNQVIAESMIYKSSLICYAFYLISKSIPWESFNKINSAITLKKKFDAALGQSKY